jgi:glycosyltransferase involved in cell wall biosynthesis
MKIAIVTGGVIPFSPKLIDSPHSIVSIAYLLTEELVRRGHEVTAFVPSDSKTSARIAPGWFPSTSPYFKYKLETLQRKKLFKKYCENIISQSSNFDIIHIHDIYLDGYKILKKLPIPVIGTFHTVRLNRLNKKLIDKTLVAISKQQIKNNPKINFLGMVYNGIAVDLYPFNPQPKDYLLWMGRITPQKGALEAIEVASLTGKKLVMIGTIPSLPPLYKKYVKKVIREIKGNKNVKFLGFAKNFKEKVNCLKNARCLLMPINWEEPFGLVMTEAMACGTPVIAFNRGAVPEIVKDGITGFVVNTVSQMTKAIERIPKISRKECREWVGKKFTVKKMTEGYEKIYREVIKKYKKD